MKFSRIFCIVMDSVGIGYLPDAARFGDEGTNTWVHVSEAKNGLNIPVLNFMGLHDLDNRILGTSNRSHRNTYVQTLREASNGKDTLTGHWEMMGLLTPNPLVTFTDTGFPKELLDELTAKTGYKYIGNYSQSGTTILKELGKQSMEDKSIIIYTSADSVLQLAANVDIIPLSELYRCCEVAREITMKPEWRVGRVIARPFVGNETDGYTRTSDRKDYALSPNGRTALNDLVDNGYEVVAVGKINDIFNGSGITESFHTVSNHDGMIRTKAIAKFHPFKGLCFVNLVEFDSAYGHRRDPLGYAKCIEEFDKDLAELLPFLHDDDLLLITADHGNDPTWTGTDHTRERVPLLAYSRSFSCGDKLEEQETFACIGKTILKNFNITPSENQIGRPIDLLLKENA